MVSHHLHMLQGDWRFSEHYLKSSMVFCFWMPIRDCDWIWQLQSSWEADAGGAAYMAWHGSCWRHYAIWPIESSSKSAPAAGSKNQIGERRVVSLLVLKSVRAESRLEKGLPLSDARPGGGIDAGLPSRPVDSFGSRWGARACVSETVHMGCMWHGRLFVVSRTNFSPPPPENVKAMRFCRVFMLPDDASATTVPTCWSSRLWSWWLFGVVSCS
mmetsp:Transcript_31743/g.94737  ORF Transcript_31743/g.94737 Transcript_31743/m.94737 type:complete len:214 (-) Transcript_31743:800-1441(-)